jgi:membrane-bound lytic murein transglycosylase B
VGAATLGLLSLPAAAGAGLARHEQRHQTSTAAAPDLDLAALAPVAPGMAGVPHVSRDLAEVEVESPDLDRATETYTAAAERLRGAQSQRRDVERVLGELTIELDRASLSLAMATARERTYKRQHDTVLRSLQELLVAVFVAGGYETGDDAYLDPSRANIPARRRVLTEVAFETLEAEERRLSELVDAAARDREKASATRDEVAGRLQDSTAARDSAADTQARSAQPVAEARGTLESERAIATVVGGDFALVALDAYRRAAASVANEPDSPACTLEWWGLAGISRVEGRHGTFGGARLDAFGGTDPRIIGIALNGERQTRMIGDSDGGTLDGDPLFDRAVGPMQFIPSTWARWASDGDGDGMNDPHNLYDATRAAARYLCRASLDLVNDEGLQRGYFSYNHSLLYVAGVLHWARHYQQIEVPPADPERSA